MNSTNHRSVAERFEDATGADPVACVLAFVTGFLLITAIHLIGG